MAAFFAILSGLVAVIGGPFYLYDIIKGTTKPARSTWFIWTVQGAIAFGSQAVLGAHWSLLYSGLNFGGNLIVWLLSLKYGFGGWQRIDIAALIIAAGGFVLSVVTHAPTVALVGVIVADFAGTVPTLLKAYRRPASETTITWLALGTSALLAIFSVGSMRWTLWLYPVYLAAANYAVVGAQLLGRWRHMAGGVPVKA